MKVENTSSWPWQRIARYTGQITAHFMKLAARFPDDVTPRSIAAQCMSGEKTLWLVMDGETVLMTGATQIRTIDATGKKIAVLCDLAGENVAACADDLCNALEAWARDKGADLMAVEGRPGWGREMKKRGYREYAVLWRKEVA